MDVADTGRQHVHTQIRDHLALIRIRAFAFADYSVFLTAEDVYKRQL